MTMTVFETIASEASSGATKLDSRRGAVIIDTTEHGWRITGAPYRRPYLGGQYNDQHVALGQFRAEVTRCDCGVEDPRPSKAGERLTQSRTMTLNASRYTEELQKGLEPGTLPRFEAGDLIPLGREGHIRRGACDNLGHWQRVVDLARKVLKTY